MGGVAKNVKRSKRAVAWLWVQEDRQCRRPHMPAHLPLWSVAASSVQVKPTASHPKQVTGWAYAATAHQLQTDSQAERANCTIEDMLRAWVSISEPPSCRTCTEQLHANNHCLHDLLPEPSRHLHTRLSWIMGCSSTSAKDNTAMGRNEDMARSKDASSICFAQSSAKATDVN